MQKKYSKQTKIEKSIQLSIPLKMVYWLVGSIFVLIAINSFLGLKYFLTFNYIKNNFFTRNSVIIEAKELIKKQSKRMEKKPIFVYNPSNAVFKKFVKIDMQDVYRLHNPVVNSNYKKSLDNFFYALTRNILSAQNEQVVVDFLGDSVVAGDFFPHVLRRYFHHYFGDGGTGFVTIAKPFNSYKHNDIEYKKSNWKIVRLIDKKLPTKKLSLSGYLFIGSNTNNMTSIKTRRKFNILDIYYLAGPQFGKVKLQYGAFKKTISTVSKKSNIQKYSCSINSNGKYPLRIHADKKLIYLYGLNFRNKSGAVLNTYPVLGSRINLLRRIQRTNWMNHLKLDNPSLVILMFGINNSGWKKMPEKFYTKALQIIIYRIKQAIPNASILFIGPMGYPELKDGKIIVKPIMYDIMRIQEKTAIQSGCAYFDLFHALGGEKSLEKWYGKESKLVSKDYIHLSPEAGEIIGSLLWNSLMKAYRDYLYRQGYMTRSLQTNVIQQH